MYISYLARLSAVLIISLMGCSSARDATLSEPRPKGNAYPTYIPPIKTSMDEPSVATMAVIDSTLSLGDVLARSLLLNPSLRSFAWEIRAREARILQAKLPPNPEIGGEVENFNGTGELGGFDSAEVTFGLSQLVEIGGDRQMRQRVASHEKDLAEWDYEMVKLDVLTETTQAFVAVLAAQERLRLSDTLRGQADRFYETVLARIDAGKVSALEEKKARVVLTTARLDYAAAIRELMRTRSRLAATWGSTEVPSFRGVQGDLYVIKDVTGLEAISGLIDRNPDVARWRDEMALRRAEVSLEEAARIPDPIVGIGTRRLRDLGANALTASISIPLPLFNRNQGVVKEAQYRIEKTQEAQRAATVLAHHMLTDAYQQLSMAYEETQALRDEILPAARESFEAMQEGYREGKFDLLMVLDAQRTFFEATNRYIDALETYHLTRSEVERLIGTPLSDI